MEFLVVVKSLRVIVVGFQAIASPPEALDASTAMELLFFQRRESRVWRFRWCFLFPES
jgi:hypothetical protein